MCSSPKSNGCYIPPKKPTRSILAGFSAEQRRSFAAAANQAQERKEQRQQLQKAAEERTSKARRLQLRGHYKLSLSQGPTTSRKNTLQRWSAFIVKLGAAFYWSNWWRAREL